jgi:hypothetical protein
MLMSIDDERDFLFTGESRAAEPPTECAKIEFTTKNAKITKYKIEI